MDELRTICDEIDSLVSRSLMTHIVTFYGGTRERVLVIDDRTDMNYGFRYGSMLVADTFGAERWIHFGIYNATDIQPIR